MFNEKYSHERKFTYDSSKNDFIDLVDFINNTGKKEFVVRAMFTYEGKYGTRPCIVTDGYNVTVPNHITEDVKSIMANEAEVAAVNAGKCGFRVRHYIDNNGVDRLSGSFFDI